MAVGQGGARQHRVQIDFPYERQIIFDHETLFVKPGDTIEWELVNSFPFSIVIKAMVSPLNSGSFTAEAGSVIRAVVRENASPGYYPYAICITNGKTIIIEDPEIIVRPPKGG